MYTRSVVPTRLLPPFVLSLASREMQLTSSFASLSRLHRPLPYVYLERRPHPPPPSFLRFLPVLERCSSPLQDEGEKRLLSLHARTQEHLSPHYAPAHSPPSSCVCSQCSATPPRCSSRSFIDSTPPTRSSSRRRTRTMSRGRRRSSLDAGGIEGSGNMGRSGEEVCVVRYLPNRLLRGRMCCETRGCMTRPRSRSKSSTRLSRGL
ncbi:hypothetical protein B0H12DRAFT_785701 [Mycena haematopus]|nr:hypothetical protein B0H12DRAFT_785701 [Mycena haematopus]